MLVKRVSRKDPVKLEEDEITSDSCTADNLNQQYYLMHQFHHKDAHNSVSRFYNTIWIVRWILVAGGCALWYNIPRTIYVLLTLSDVVMVIITIYIRKSFRKGFTFGLILAEEIMIFFWHVCGTILFFDYYGSRNQKVGILLVAVYTMLIALFVTLIIEFLLFVMGIADSNKYYTSAGEEPAN